MGMTEFLLLGGVRIAPMEGAIGKSPGARAVVTDHSHRPALFAQPDDDLVQRYDSVDIPGVAPVKS